MSVETHLGGTAPLPLSRLRRQREHPETTPAGLQDKRVLATRRALMLALNIASVAALAWAIHSVFAPGGLSIADWVILGAFLVGAPWTVMGMWNALFGLWLLHGRRDGLAEVAPHLAAGDSVAPIQSRTAVVMTLRNEPPLRSLERLVAIRESLDETGWGQQFDIHVLSDTTDPETAAEEERLFAALRPALGGSRAQYRRRRDNTGFKAGNIRDFVTGAGLGYDLFVPLDSDSLMSGPAILRMVRIMEAHPRIGILQSLVVGAPAKSAFARIFQFGMRHGMRSFTMGAAWWQGDCGPYWGHNAAIRMGAFRRHCRLPLLPGGPPLGGHILSHDQVEAALMRRAGYEVRVMPVEGESWEENPPTLQDFTKRDLRWCQGNMQYWSLLGLKGLRPTSRFQIFAAIMMYFGGPAWMLMTLAAAAKVFEGDTGMDAAMGIAMFFVMISVSLVPKLAGLLDIALRRGGAAAYGGRLRFAAGGLVELVFSMLTAPVVAFRVTLFLIGLMFGRTVTWNGQNRDVYRLTWGDAARGLWPQMLAAAVLTAVLAGMVGPGLLLWAAPMLLGLGLAIPLAVWSAAPRVGAWAARTGLCAVPEEIAGAEMLARLGRVAQPETTARAA
ncbi:glucans biosynthesis glucosyltransferase MdoH [Paralimibaculum aggregatum]|uniref:Glucans biosynthesis glucosyltransferase H n=1 Tax=Paralimibaculum aggregatum TaxID=3036245 RepID=A0ABQ6LN85_9RHOB|nr:glucans biosynthesis glucosyltransferase MdoH [Limibaculum sp. NKW23]GMG81891.1 glucans biosynthesis glucosyltransferase MdoH [Limibaculum sp. NKW23]